MNLAPTPIANVCALDADVQHIVVVPERIDKDHMLRQWSLGATGSFASLNVMSCMEWLECCWREAQWQGHKHASDVTWLSRLESLWLMQESIRASDDEPNALHAWAASALAAHEQWGLHHMPAHHDWPGELLEHRRFNVWHQHYISMCHEHRLADAALIIQPLTQSVPDVSWPFTRITAMHANTWPKAFQSLLHAFQEAGVQVEHHVQQKPVAKCFATQATTFDQGLMQGARWLSDQASSAMHLGLIVPDEKSLSIVDVDAVFASVGLAARAWPAAKLSQNPFVQTTMILIKSLVLPLEAHELQALAHAPWLPANIAQCSARAAWCWQWQSRGQATYNAATPALFEEFKDSSWQDWLTTLAGFATRARRLNDVTEWSKLLKEALNTLGWAEPQAHIHPQALSLGERLLDAIDRYPNVLQTNLKHTPNSMHANFVDWVDTLREAASSDWRKRKPVVSVVTAKQAECLAFDASVLIGFSADAWGLTPKPHPLLPREWQAKCHWPLATSDQASAWSHAWLAKRQTLDGASVLIDIEMMGDIHQLPAVAFNAWRDTPYLFNVSTEFKTYGSLPGAERIHDELAPSLNLPTSVPGGAHTLKLQASCPFKAFASIRLEADEVPAPEPLVDARTRGWMLHQALEIFWREVKDSAALNILLLEQDTPEVLTMSVDKAIDKWRKTALNKSTPELLAAVEQAERRALMSLLRAWLEVEQQRPPFSVIGIEQEQVVDLSGMTLHLRVDRIDSTEQGHILIDYKSGAVTPASWRPDSLTEPQLPLYFVSHDSHVSALLFARLKPGILSFAGLTDNADVAKAMNITELGGRGTPSDWATWKTQWLDVLNTLAKDFSDGHAAVDPMSNKSCEYCHLHGLCRIHETATSWESGPQINS